MTDSLIILNGQSEHNLCIKIIKFHNINVSNNMWPSCCYIILWFLAIENWFTVYTIRTFNIPENIIHSIKSIQFIYMLLANHILSHKKSLKETWCS